jgi:hypothetical protein
VVGIFVSALLYLILVGFYGYQFMFYRPKDNDVIAALLMDDAELKADIIRDEGIVWTKKNTRLFYKYHQAKVKECINGEKLHFLERRWSTVWTFANSLFAIILALAIVFLKILFTTGFSHLSFDWNFYKVFGLICLTVFSRASWYQLRNSWIDAREVENLWLAKEIKMK